ncbi:MAG: methyltransferase domain-containing protein [Nitrospirae bacterium]|nr:methyltransferase domain-containing protein [Nitrospirota bacterium]
MNTSFIELLRCIDCKGNLTLSEEHGTIINDGCITNGVLLCKECGARFPVIDGVGVFFPEHLMVHYLNTREQAICKTLGLNYATVAVPFTDEEQKVHKVATNWSYQWTEIANYSREDLQKKGFYSEELFFTFIPVVPEHLNDKSVVVWCGGKGREAYHISKHKPKYLIVNEIGDEIYQIRNLIQDTMSVCLLRCDITNNPLSEGFADYSICDHALHHVLNHSLAFEKMVEVLKPGGIAGINVYSHEHNILMTHIVEPLKFLLHKLPLKVQRKISFLPASLIFSLIHLLYVPASKILPSWICKRLPLYDHMLFWSSDNFNFIWTACFDLIHAPISYHFKEHEIKEMVTACNVRIKTLFNTHGTTWSMVGEKY